MLNCVEVTRLYSEAQDRRLSLKERMNLQMHVAMCSGCRNFGRHMHVLRQVTRAYTEGVYERGEEKPKE